ncbi:hypothetical protein QSG86_05750 [Acinetobacter sp. SAAs474]|nr:hypothetical protein QSG86_05750 [Acinetobacter sp. SAAs474]
MLFLAFIFWIFTEKDTVTLIEKESETSLERQIQPEKVAATTYLGGLTDEVKPLEKTVRIQATDNHDAEFRGTKFIGDRQNNYTIELFRTNKEDVIKDFLRRQNSRDGFFYIRLSSEDIPEQYVLLYGDFVNQFSADSALGKLEIGLPASVKPTVQTFKNYMADVNDLGAEEMGLNNALYAVKLTPAPIPKPAIITEPVTPSATLNVETPTTTTTVTRKDQQGNIVDIQTSQTKPLAPSNTSQSTNTP